MSTEICLFCLEIAENQSNIKFDCNCNLIFHDSCIQKWMEFTHIPQCPLCRQIIDDSEPVTHDDDYLPDSFYYYDIQFCYIFFIIITLFTFVILVTYYIISHY